jgi:hypothetical protein
MELLFDLFWGQSVLEILVEVVYISQISIIPNYRNFYKVVDTQFAALLRASFYKNPTVKFCLFKTLLAASNAIFSPSPLLSSGVLCSGSIYGVG